VWSIEPDGADGEMETGEEVSGGFIVTGGDGAGLSEFYEELFNQVSCQQLRSKPARL
jgi:hypothetical protein